MKIDVKDPELTFAEVILKIDGKEYFAKSITYGDAVASGEVRGNHQMARGTTDGEYTTEDGTVELYRADFDELVKALGKEFYRKRFSSSVSYARNGKAATTDELHGCKFTKRSANLQGSDATVTSVGLRPHYVKWAGQPPLSNMPQV